jgi:tetratricopeptide (TPR) repeat protein
MMREGLAAIILMASSCRAPGTGPYAPAGEPDRDTARAQGLSRQAADLLSDDPDRAEALLREALTADLFFGPAHNNLGVLHLQAGRLYEAAGEFEWARKLMPGHPDPRMNLALTLERAGQADEAIQAYEAALEVYPGHVPTLQAMARLCVASGRDDPRLEGWMHVIALQGETEAWRSWARRPRGGQLAGDP